MAALMFLVGNGIKASTHTHAEIVHFPTQCVIRTWDARGLWPRASQALMMHLVGKYAISARALVLAIVLIALPSLYEPNEYWKITVCTLHVTLVTKT